MSGGGAAPGVTGTKVVMVTGGNGLGGKTGDGNGIDGGKDRDERVMGGRGGVTQR